MVGLCIGRIALFDRLRDLFAYRTIPVSVGFLPSQTILLARVADDPLGVLVYAVTLAFLVGIFILRLHVAMANVNGIEFVAADTAIEELLAPGFGIEMPFIGYLHHRYGKWPVFIAHEQECTRLCLCIHGDAFLFPSLSSKVGGPLTILWVFARQNDVVAIGTEDFFENTYVEFLCRVNQRIGGLLRGVEGLSSQSNRSRGLFCGGLLWHECQG